MSDTACSNDCATTAVKLQQRSVNVSIAETHNLSHDANIGYRGGRVVTGTLAYIFLHEQVLYSGFCHDHYTRQVSSGHLVVPSHNLNSMLRTVLHRAFTAWNMLQIDIRNTRSRYSFKRLLKHKLMGL